MADQILKEKPTRQLGTQKLFSSIGSGSYGEVFISCSDSTYTEILRRNKVDPSDQILACKRISLRNPNTNQLYGPQRLKLIEEEIKMAERLNHPNTVRFIDTF